MKISYSFVKRILFFVVFASLIACSNYRSYKISSDGSVRRFRERQLRNNPMYGRYTASNFTYHIPQAICELNDISTLKIYADLIYKRHVKRKSRLELNVLDFTMTSDSLGVFETHDGLRIIHGYRELLYNRSQCVIVYRAGYSPF